MFSFASYNQVTLFCKHSYLKHTESMSKKLIIVKKADSTAFLRCLLAPKEQSSFQRRFGRKELLLSKHGNVRVVPRNEAVEHRRKRRRRSDWENAPVQTNLPSLFPFPKVLFAEPIRILFLFLRNFVASSFCRVSSGIRPPMGEVCTAPRCLFF